MEEENFFDQFDDQPVEKETGGNFFDQFDETVNPENQVDETGVPGQSQVATEAQIAEQNLPNDEKPLDDILTTGMYRSGDPEKTYQRFKEEGTVTGGGFLVPEGISYKGRMIPRPEKTPTVELDEEGKLAVKYKPTGEIDYKDKVGQASTNAVKELALSVSSIVDAAANAIGMKTDLTSGLDVRLPEPLKPEGAGDELIKGGVEIGTGVLFGRAVAGPIGGLIGSQLAVDKDTEPLLFGKGKIFEGVPSDPNDPAYQELIAKKMNLLFEAALLAKPVEWAGNGVAYATKIVKNVLYDQIAPMVSKGAQENLVTTDIVTKLNTTTPERIDQLVNSIRNNKELNIQISNEIGEGSLERTTMSAIHQGAEQPMEVPKDAPWLPQQEGQIEPLGKAVGVRAMELEKGGIERALPELQLKMEQPIEALRDVQRNAVVSKGGFDTIKTAKQEFGQKGVGEITDARQAVLGAEDAVLQAEDSVKKMLRESPEFGSLINQMEKDVGFDIYSGRKQATESVMKNLVRGVDNIIKQKNELYNKIPEDVIIDMDSFTKVVVDNQDVLKHRLKSVVDIIADPNKMIDFRSLNNEILPRINAEISRLKSLPTQNSGSEISALMSIRDNILDTQMQYLENHGEKAVADMAREARNYYKSVYLQYNKDGTPIGRLFDAYFEEYGNRMKTMTMDEQGLPPDYSQATRVLDQAQSAASGVTENKIGSSNQILDFLNREEVPGQSEQVIDIYLGDAAADMARKLGQSDGISKINPDDIIKNLGNKGTFIRERFPEKYNQIVEFTTKLRNAQGNVEELKSILTQQKQLSSEAERNVLDGVLGDFISVVDGQPLVKGGNGYQTFKTLLRGDKNYEKIQKLTELARNSNDPMVLRGMKSAYYEYLREMIQNSTTGINPKEATKFLGDEVGNRNLVKNYGEMIFGKDDPELQLYEAFIDAVAQERDKRMGKSIAALPRGYVQEGARGAINTGATFVFGVLNRMGAMINRAGSQMIKMYDPEQQMTATLDTFHSNPDEAIRMLEDLSHSLKSKIPSEYKQVLWETFVRSNLNLAQGNEEQAYQIFNQAYDQTLSTFGSSEPASERKESSGIQQDMHNLK